MSGGVKVTESLRRQWANQREQMLEEREFTQSGRPRSAADIALVDLDVAIHDRLLALPLGTKFDAQQIQKEVEGSIVESAFAPVVIEGRVKVNSVYPLAVQPNVEVWLIDCASKYPEVVQSMDIDVDAGTERHEVFLCVGDYTRDLDTSTEDITCVTFPSKPRDEGWEIAVDHSGYSVTVVLYNPADSDHFYDYAWHTERTHD